MSNFKNVEYCKCDDCVHNKICMYKQSLTNVFTKLMNDIGEDKFSDDAPFILKIDCQFKTTNNPIPKTTTGTVITLIIRFNEINKSLFGFLYCFA